jgi:WD40 repeat protein
MNPGSLSKISVMSIRRQTRTPRILIWVTVIILFFSGFIAYYQLGYQSKKVESNIFTLHRIFQGHRSCVWSIKFSPKGDWLASGSVDSTVRIWDKANGRPVQQLKQPAGITYLDISADGNFIATASYDGKLRLWKVPEGTLVKEFSGHKGTVWSVCFSPDGKTIASSGEDATIKMWDVQSGNLTRTLRGHALNVWDVKFSPDGKMVASGSFDRSIKIWNAQSGELVKTLADHTEAVVALAFSPDGKKLASTSDDKTIRIWNTNDWSLLQTMTVPEHAQAVAFSPDNKWLLTGGRDKPAIGELLQNFFGDSWYNKGVSMRLWEVNTGKLLQTFSVHGNDVNDVSWSADGKWIATGSADQTVGLWRLNRPE